MKFYVIVPLVALLAFAGWRWQMSGELRHAVAAQQAALEAKRAAELKAEQDTQRQTMAAVLAEQEQRKKDRATLAARELADQAARQTLLNRLDAARRRTAELVRHVEVVQRDIADEKKSIAELESTKKSLQAEQSVLRELSAKAEANIKGLNATIEKFTARATGHTSTP